jgi:hypothetical protein
MEVVHFFFVTGDLWLRWMIYIMKQSNFEILQLISMSGVDDSVTPDKKNKDLWCIVAEPRLEVREGLDA